MFISLVNSSFCEAIWKTNWLKTVNTCYDNGIFEMIFIELETYSRF